MSTQINLSKRIAIKDEGITLTPNVNSINFEGNGVTVTTSTDDVTVTVPGSFGSTIFYLNESVTQAPYKEFSAIATTAVEQVVPFTVAGGATVTVASYQTPAGVPGTTIIPGGLWQFYLHFNATTAGQNWRIRPLVYKRDLGGVETLILTSDPVVVTNMPIGTTQYLSDAVIPTTSLLITDRLVVKIDMQNTTGVSQTANFRTEGSQHYSVVANTLNQNMAIPAPGIIVLGSGTCSTMRCGVGNTATGACSAALSGSSNTATNPGAVIAGGESNAASGFYSTIAGGRNNTSSNYTSFVGSGICNRATGFRSSIVGGIKNLNNAIDSFIGGGNCNNTCNSTSGCLSYGAVVVGGVGNNTTGGTWDLATCSFTVAPTICNAGLYSFVGGGIQNNATGSRSTVGGGLCNLSSGLGAVVGGGTCNTSSYYFGFIGSGVNNISSSNRTVVGGGGNNTASANYSSVVGGKQNTASAYYSVILGGQCNITSGRFSTNGGGFKNLAQAIGGFIGGGNCNNVCNSTNGCLAYGAVVVGGVGNNTTGGTFNIASCCFSVAPTICNAGRYSFVGGGFQNRATGTNSAVSGGQCNTSSATDSFVGGGFGNVVSGTSTTIGGGVNNLVATSYSSMVGGLANKICLNTYSCFYNSNESQTDFLGGGQANCIQNTNLDLICSTIYSFNVLGGGLGNIVGLTSASGYYSNIFATSTLVGGYQNQSRGQHSSLVGGQGNRACATASFVGGGLSNFVLGQSSSVVGGENNCNCGATSFLGGGYQNLVNGNSSTIVGGSANCITSLNSTNFIGGGISNTISGTNTNAILQGRLNISSGSGYDFIGNGVSNVNSGSYSTIVNGNLNQNNAWWGFIGNGICNVTCNVTSGCNSAFSVVVGGVANNTTGGTFNSSLFCFSVAPTKCTSGQYSFIGGGFQNRATGFNSAVVAGQNNTASSTFSTILGGCNNVNACCCSFVAGNGITADRICSFFVNNLSIKNIPTSSAGLPAGSVWSNLGVLQIV